MQSERRSQPDAKPDTLYFAIRGSALFGPSLDGLSQA